MAGYQRRHTPIKLATYSKHKIIFNVNILTKKTPKRTQNESVLGAEKLGRQCE